MSYQLRLADVSPGSVEALVFLSTPDFGVGRQGTLPANNSQLNLVVIDNAFLLSYYRKGLQFPRKMK